MKSDKRIEWVDYVKGIAIMLMMFGHLPMENTIYNDFIYSFHMPVFFFVSGFFMTNNTISFNAYLQKACRQLLVPYMLLYLLTIPVGIFTITIHPELFGYPSKMDLLWKPIIGMLLGEYMSFTSFSLYTNGPLWFLVAMFWVRCFAFATIRLNPIKRILFSFLCAYLCVHFLSQKAHVNLFGSLDSAFYATPFYLLGNIVYKSKFFNLIIKSRKCYLLIISAFLFVILWFSSQYNGRMDVCAILCGKSFILTFVNAVLGSFALVCLCASLPKNQFLGVLGRCSILILAFNTIALYIIRYAFNLFFHVSLSSYSLVIGILVTLFATCALLPLSLWIINKFPVLAGRG